MQVEYIIVGQGFAGSFFAWQCIKHNRSFVIINEEKKSASAISSGIYNPVVLKRFTLIWNALEQIQELRITMTEMEAFFNQSFHEKSPIFRIIDNEQEVKTWRKKSRNKLKSILNADLFESKQSIIAPFGLGEVHHTGRVFSEIVLDTFREYAQENQCYFQEKFDYNQLKITNNSVLYRHIYAKNIVFCEGYNMIHNPFFSYIPIQCNKGESLEISFPESTSIDESIYKKKFFLYQKKNGNYFVGGTNDSQDVTEHVTESKRDEMVKATKELIHDTLQVENQQAALRTTTLDYRPLVGTHRDFQNIHIINGMGTRGILLANICSQSLFQSVENGIQIPVEIDCNRTFNGHIYE